MKWFKSTSLGMWWTNRKNGISIISEKEYERITRNNKMKVIFI